MGVGARIGAVVGGIGTDVGAAELLGVGSKLEFGGVGSKLETTAGVGTRVEVCGAGVGGPGLPLSVTTNVPDKKSEIRILPDGNFATFQAPSGK